METPGGQNPTFWPKMTTNIGIIQITSLFGPSDNVIQSQIYIQDKAWWYLFIINCITGGGVIPYMETPGVKNPYFDLKWPQILILSKQAASCKGEGFKRVKLRKEGLKGLEKFEVGKVRNLKSLKLEKFEVGKDRSWKRSTLQNFKVRNVRRLLLM